VVHDLERGDAEVANGKRLVRMNLMKLNSWHTRITMFSKAIWQHLEHPLTGNRVSINVDFAKLAIGPDIIHTTHVVVVCMRDEYAIDTTERVWHNLLSEIRSTIDEQPGTFRLDESRTAQTLIVRVWAGACVALTANGWDATGCSGSKKSQFHIEKMRK
jgi:hypothetical protein